MINNQKSVGVILTRGQPFHKGHIRVINQASEENDYVLVVIGSADKEKSPRNPLSIEYRTYLFEKVQAYLNNPNVYYMTLDDWSSDSDIPYKSSIGSENTDFKSVSGDWGMYLYYNIVNRTKRKDFTLYYNDDVNIIDSWFPKFIKERLMVKTSERIPGFSSSEVRKALTENNNVYLKDALPYLTEGEIIKLKEEILL